MLDSMPAPRATLSDVAAVAGVSLSTASKALNGSTRISAATRERVAAAATRLDFRPNALAQSFASGRSRTVGIHAHRATSTFSQPVLIGAIRELGRHQQACLVNDADRHSGLWTFDEVRDLQARRVDGILVVGDGHERVAHSLTEHFNAPVVYAFTDSDRADDEVWLPDNETIGAVAARHLVEQGRRRIAHLTGPATSLAARARARGARDALAEHGLEFVSEPRFDRWNSDAGTAGVQELLASEVAFDAIFCGNDHIALATLTALTEGGRRVPEDVALVGVDNWEGVVVDQDTRIISTVDPQLLLLGASAARSLLGLDPQAEVRVQDGRRLLAPALLVGPTS